MSFHDRLLRYARKHKGVITNDPDAVLGTLQIAKRLFMESLTKPPALTVIQAVDRAIPLAAPKDPVRVRRYVIRVLLKHTHVKASPLTVLTDAIAAQGKVNSRQAKGPQP
jgi:hypothetical protein